MTFIDSIDKDAICALASKHNGGLSCNIRCQSNGSFNVCFVVDFSDGTTRLVRLPLEPAVHDVWDKVCSEVYTMQYLRDHTNIPIPQVYAYGRSRLQRNSSALQVFMFLGYIDGRPLEKAMLRKGSKDQRHQLLSEIADVLAQLRGLEFSQGGSLIGNNETARALMPPREESFTPQSTKDPICRPQVVGAFSLRKNELQVDGYNAPRFIATTAGEFIEEQYRLMHCLWSIPYQHLSQQCAERQLFAVYTTQQTLGLEGDGDTTFCLLHPDFRAENIIVDDELHLRGIIDWEFSELVPRLAFVPPVWITGHDPVSVGTKISLFSEFLSILSSRKHISSGHSQLADEWDLKDNIQFPMAHILRDPNETEFLFYEYLYPELYSEPRDDFIPAFFQRSENKELRQIIQQRVHASKQYTQYLRDHNLLDEEAQKWQEIRESIAASKKRLEESRESDAWIQELLANADKLLHSARDGEL
ncbi:kinase-like domain-containing protein [Bombardia bombarda]|uniref:Kinase-like domain-containing protein n=1 Tax=Bombardia bombarda TaxID=252184 RepID=A0AA39TIT7_9PEZI|nr:kinase-like domain-containing protein [Bombardia bombarda]